MAIQAEVMPELKGAYPVVVYLKDKHDAAEFVRLCQEAQPGLKPKPLR